ncbi:Arylsulfatase [Sinobacterium norvegicum]|uniref:Arylsulfatase n=1 Tax=Sinobacterium norvegicum TaxID=1641715 RepID=A0ABM9AEX6_9GAMM|nr:sulfatase-like hydrolase/transferase [Sinobacterium norvegicum]CAH0991505.1 Arylsulfatase [Sinobacterium norvegicum]
MKLSRYFLALITIACSTLVSAKQPNIIIMVADDLGWADVGFHGNIEIDTPSLDRIAAEGSQLDRFYTTPICSPTRAALMTGRNPMRLGVAYGVIMPWDNTGIHPDEHFMPQSFEAAGYQTAMVGKWHLGHAQQSYHPNSRGFQHFYGHQQTEVGFYPPFANQGGKDFQQNGVSIDDQGYESYLLADEVSRYIVERDQSKPFFIYMPFLAPHTPLDAPQELQDKYKDINTDLAPARSPDTDNTRTTAKILLRPSARPMYAAVVDGMDQAIGRVLTTLDEEKLTDDTIVLFFSDNGGAAYSVGGADNVPLRGGKGDTFEGGIRVVSAIRWPGKIAAGRKMGTIMSVMDVFPTLSAAAGIEPQNQRKFDGINMWPAIADGKKIVRDDYLFFASETPIYGHFNLTIFNNQWKLIQVVDQDQMSTTVTNYLFDINNDPYEYNNIAANHPSVVADLAGKIHDWRALYPINGTRSHLVPPPGWRAPKDWADYTMPLDKLQNEPAPGMPPAFALRPLDRMHGERGRLVYDCETTWWSLGLCIKNN